MRSNSSIHGVSGLIDGLSAADRFISNRENEEIRDRQIGLQEAAYGRDEERHNAQMSEHRSQMEMQDLAKQEAFGQVAARYAMILEGMDAGELSPEQNDLISKHPTLSPEFINSQEASKAIETYESVKAGKIRFDSPEAIEAINIISPEVNLGASDGRKRKVKSIVPGQQPGEFYFGLEVEGDPQERPLTDRRSSDPDDPVKAVKAEDLIGKFEGLKQYRMLLNSKKGRQALIQAYSPAAKKGSTTYGPIVTDKTTGLKGQYDSTGQFHPVDARKGGSTGSGRGGSTPARIQTYQFFEKVLAKQLGREPTVDEVESYANSRARDPAGFAMDYAKMMTDSGKTPEQLLKEGRDQHKKLFGGGTDNSSSEPDLIDDPEEFLGQFK